MTKRRFHSHAPRSHQGGMTLLVGLILLLMLTVISTIGFRNTTMSERMTGNSVDRNVSFQSAESAGKEALTVIESNAFSPTATVGHFGTTTYLAQGGTTNFWTQGDGATVATPSAATCYTVTPFSWKSCASPVAAKYANNASTATYVIELLTSVPSGTTTVSTYRVTSRSTGGSGNADVVIQTLYTRSP